MAIVLFTDFGSSDPYVGQVEAVLDREAPLARVIHLLHAAPPFNVRAGAHLLAALAHQLPPGQVFIGVVDPGVGTDRAGVVMRANASWYVGPDNGLFSVIAARAADRAVWRIAHGAPHASPTFHGRDVFAPIAAAIAIGRFPNADVEEADDLSVRLGGDDLAEVIYVDHYGNAFTGIRARGLPHSGRLGASGRKIPHARVFAEAPPGVPFWYENSSGLVEIAVNRGSAAATLGLAVGAPVAWED